MNIFAHCMEDSGGINDERHGKYAHIHMLPSLASDLEETKKLNPEYVTYTGPYSGGAPYRAMLEWFEARFGAHHDVVQMLKSEFNDRATRP